MCTAVMAAALCAVCGAQQLAPRPGVYRVGGGVTPPVLLEKQPPEYSDEARIARLQGMVVLYVVVGEDGRARDMRVTRSLGLGLDEKAMTGVTQWRFAPGTKAGQPVAVEATIEVNFRLLPDPRGWYLSHVSFTAPPGASRPLVIHAKYRPSAGLPESASVRLSFDVDAKGVPRHIQADQSSDPEWNREVVAMVRDWRFRAAMDNGTAVASRATLDFSRGWPAPAKPKQ
jgi:TonB family protein